MKIAAVASRRPDRWRTRPTHSQIRTTRITLRNFSQISPHVPNSSIEPWAIMFTSSAPR